jgi:hypothetical protein
MGRRRRKAPAKRQAVQQNQLSAFSRGPSLLTHRFRRVFQETISGSVAGIVSYNPLVTLDKLPSFSDFVNLYTEYRIVHLKVLFRPLVTTFSLIGASSYPVINTVFDYANNVSLVSTTEAQQFPSWKQNALSVSRPVFQIDYTPRVINTAMFAAVSGGSALFPIGTFLGMQNTTVQHLGLKTMIQDFPSGVQMEVSVVVDLECRGVR